MPCLEPAATCKSCITFWGVQLRTPHVPPTPFLPPSSFLPFLLLRLGPRAAGDCVLRALEREPGIRVRVRVRVTVRVRVSTVGVRVRVTSRVRVRSGIGLALECEPEAEGELLLLRQRARARARREHGLVIARGGGRERGRRLGLRHEETPVCGGGASVDEAVVAE